jgi:glyoxylase-like metal-dependent hydrolase (beta-lactamase superfamily II)
MELYQIEQLVLGPFAVNCWIVVYGVQGVHGVQGVQGDDQGEGSRRCALIDPGAEPDRIMARLKKLSLPPSHILLTHGHFDHILALPDIHAAYPDAPIAIHRDDRPCLGPEGRESYRRILGIDQGDSAFAGMQWKEMPLSDRELGDGDTIGPFKVLSTPGHTPGSAAFLLEDQKILFSGDTLFRGDCGRVDLPGGNRQQIEKSLERLLALDGDIQVLPGHGESTTIAAERGTRFF